MRRAGTLLLAAALLSLCLLAGANAALAPAWELAYFELEALAGSQEAAAGLRLYSRVTGQIAETSGTLTCTGSSALTPPRGPSAWAGWPTSHRRARTRTRPRSQTARPKADTNITARAGRCR